MEFCNQTLQELECWLSQKEEKTFYAKSLFQWIYQKGILDFSEMTNLSKRLRDSLQETFSCSTLKLLGKEHSETGETVKFLWQLSDGAKVESVLIYAPGRVTVCVSCQVGCPVGCFFCASGKNGFIRNLSTAEIVEQVLLIQKSIGEKISHIVFMGMGEPLENYENVVKSIYLFSHPLAFGISQRRISLSTVGIVKQIQRLAKESFKINLVLSLHAPNQELRQEMIPYAWKTPLPELLKTMEEYFQETQRDVSYEYILIDGWNNSISHAKELAFLLNGKHCSVNLIPCNPITGSAGEKCRRPEKENVQKFLSTLRAYGISATWRYTKGKDIFAACGQLAFQESESV